MPPSRWLSLPIPRSPPAGWLPELASVAHPWPSLPGPCGCRTRARVGSPNTTPRHRCRCWPAPAPVCRTDSITPRRAAAPTPIAGWWSGWTRIAATDSGRGSAPGVAPCPGRRRDRLPSGSRPLRWGSSVAPSRGTQRAAPFAQRLVVGVGRHANHFGRLAVAEEPHALADGIFVRPVDIGGGLIENHYRWEGAWGR